VVPPERLAVLTDLDRTMLRLRRLMTRMPTTSLPIGGLNRSVDLAKVVACEAIGELGRDGAAVTVKDVATALGLEQSTTSRLLGEAEAEGLVERSPHPDDRRRVVLTLTPVGEQVIVGAARARTCLLGYLVEPFSDGDLRSLADLMERLARSATERLSAWPGLPAD
jgi:DNA-binding MarR family transcriptional regulator